MNEFTKEELERICQFFNIAIEDYKEPDSTYELRDKIQSLIDNYCEHTSKQYYEHVMLYECNDCHMVTL